MTRLLAVFVVVALLVPASASAHGLSPERAQHRAARTAAQIAALLTQRAGSTTTYDVKQSSCVRVGSTGHRRDCTALFAQGGRPVCSARIRVRFRDTRSFATVVYAVDRLRC